MNRNEITLSFLDKNKNFENALEIGVRDSTILNFLKIDNKYVVDLYNTPKINANLIVFNLEDGCPSLGEDKKWDLIIANDVIEHVENKNRLLREIFQKCSGEVVISLPNTQHFSYIYGLIRGGMGKQFNFFCEDQSDRHRWITYYKSNIRWIEIFSEENKFKILSYRTVTIKPWYLKYIPTPKRFFVFNQVWHLRSVAND